MGEECQKAARALGLNFGVAWRGGNDYEGCFYYQEKVFYNKSRWPSPTPNHNDRTSICKTGNGLELNAGSQVAVGMDQTKTFCTGDYQDSSNARPPRGTPCVSECRDFGGHWGKKWCYTKKDLTQWGAECGTEYCFTEYEQKNPIGTYCKPGSKITTKEECQKAARALGLNFGVAWNGNNDYEGCFYYQEKVFYNKGRWPSPTPNHKDRTSLCKKGNSLEQNVGSQIGDVMQYTTFLQYVGQLAIVLGFAFLGHYFGKRKNQQVQYEQLNEENIEMYCQ